MKKAIFKKVSQLGHGKEALNLYNRLTGSFKYDDLVDDEIKEFELSEREKKADVLLPVVVGQSGITAYRYGILAHAFRTRGYKPVIPLCYNDLNLCYRKSPDEDGDHVCDECNYDGKSMMDAFGISTLPMSELISPEEIPADPEAIVQKYSDIQIDQFVKASARAFLKRYTIDFEDKYHQAVYNRFLESAAMLAEMYDIIYSKHDIIAAIVHDDRYIDGGIPLTIGENHSVEVYTHGLGDRDQTIYFGNSKNASSLPWFMDHKKIQDYLSTPLTNKQSTQLDQIMDQRAEGKNVRHHYSSKKPNSIHDSDFDTNIGMFTNLIWDASLEVDSATFPDVLDWIDTTIEYVAENCDWKLIIKTHPAESVHGTNQSVEKYIRKNHSPLPSHIEILSPDTEVNTYELIHDLDAGIVYNSTVGLEMTYYGKPIITGGKAPYKNFGISYDPTDVKSYKEMLKTIRNLPMSQEMRSRSSRYLYTFFVRNHIEFPFYETKGDEGDRFIPATHNRIKPGNENFDFIVDRIVKGEPVLR